jgi:apolipoprotein N-acyltransferase
VGHAVVRDPLRPPRIAAPRAVSPHLLALASGVLLALSFPRYGGPAVAWIALSPLLVALASAGVRGMAGRAFVLGLITGAAYFAGTVYWTGNVMAQYGGISMPLSAAIAGALVAFLALFPAGFAAIMAICVRRLGRPALLIAPAVWVATELGRTVLFGGFPWALVGYTQTSVLPVAQLASLTGVYGVSALVVFVSSALSFAAIAKSRSGWMALGVAGAVVIGTCGWGTARLSASRLTSRGQAVTVGLIQGNINQDQKWAPGLAADILNKYLRLTRQAADRGAQLILWPEAATPFYFEEDPRGHLIRQLARDHHVWLLIGSDQFERGRPPRSYNAAFMVRPDGSTAGVYRKVHLVPFGEYVPARRLLFFVAPLVEAVGDFAPGDAPVALPYGNTHLSAAICYEVVYPALIRQSVLQGSALLTTITNDAWFGRSSAPWQHFEMAAMRAIEQGRYLVRAANTGVSGVVDPYGRVLMQSDLFVDDVLIGHARLLDERTVYARIGDVVAYASVAATVLALASALRVRTRS